MHSEPGWLKVSLEWLHAASDADITPGSDRVSTSSVAFRDDARGLEAPTHR